MKIDKVEMLESVQGKNKMNDNHFPWDVPTKDVSEIASQFIYGEFEINDSNPCYILAPQCPKGHAREVPMWLFHAKDDSTVPTDIMQHPVYKTEIIGSSVIYKELLKLGKVNIHYTEYPVGMIHKKYSVKAHCAWIPAFENDEVKKWLFSNKLLSV